MVRPATHKHQQFQKCCATCKHSRVVAYKLDLLCFFGEADISIHGSESYPVEADCVFLGQDEVGLMEGDQYDRVWADRVVDPDDICDQWESDA
jgi:hypothetical protein